MTIGVRGALPAAAALVLLGVAKLFLAPAVVPNYPALVLLEAGVILFALALLVATPPLAALPGLLVVALLIASVRVLPALRFPHPLRLDLLYVLASLQAFVALTGAGLRCRLPGSAAVALAVLVHHWVSYSGSAGGEYVLSLLLSVVSVLLLLSLRLVRLVDSQRAQALSSSAREAELNRRLAAVGAALVEDKRRESMALLSASLAHEVNNPLHYMSGNLHFAEEHVERLREGYSGGGVDRPDATASLDDLAGILRQFRAGLERIGEVVSGLRALAQSRHELEADSDVAAVCNRALHIVGSPVSYRIDFCLEIPTGLRVACGEVDLFTVVSNLLKNAVEAIPETGHIELAAVEEGDAVRIEICDSGIGIPSTQAEAVFEPFFTSKTRPSDPEASDHLGVGLSLCRSIVERVGGRISICSREGESTCVSLTLPASPGRNAAVVGGEPGG